MWNSEVQLSMIYGSTFYCHKIPKNCDKKNVVKSIKSVQEKKTVKYLICLVCILGKPAKK